MKFFQFILPPSKISKGGRGMEVDEAMEGELTVQIRAKKFVNNIDAL